MVELLTCLLLEITDSFFRLDVLEVSINSTLRYHLAFLSDCLLEGVVYKAAIVCIVMFGFNPVCPGVSIKAFFASTVSSDENPRCRCT